ncbi:MAG: glycosyltransferase family 2 protein [Gammaproteobacteria bacterium]|nr:glycosyltransferase family 2 protein [Gammaproteobacteria bacterium]
MKQSPRISVLLPFYNCATTIAATLRSITAQTLSTWELIAVDDGSSDRSAEIVARFAAGDRRIRLFLRPHYGVTASANFAAEAAQSSLLARIDGDDLMHPQRLALQMEFLRHHPDIVLVGSRVQLFPEQRVGQGSHEYLRWQNSLLSSEEIARNIYVELPVANPSTTFRRAIFLQLGGFREGPFPEDYDFQLRLCQQGLKMAKLPQTLLFWRDSAQRLTHCDPRYSRAAFTALRAHYLQHEPLIRQQRPLAIWGAGRKSRKRAAHLLSKGIVHAVWIDIDPRKIGNLVDGKEVVAPTWLVMPQQIRQRPFILIYVTNHGAKEEISTQLESWGYKAGHDYLAVG